MSGKLYWLASYPKSGNTWMRVLLTNYFRRADEPADINRLDGGPIGSARSIFDDNVGVEASDLTQDEIERLRPLVYEKISDDHARDMADGDATDEMPPVLKVHDAYTRTSDGVPLFPKAATAGAIYLVRDPLDVAVSFAHHGATAIEKIVGHMADPHYAFVDAPRRLHNQLRQRLLTWSGHVTSWLDEPDLRVHVVRYEDLLADTAGELGQVIDFLGATVDEPQVRQAIDFSRFDRLQAQEAESGFREKMPAATSFFRSGTSGSWRDELSVELADRIRSDHHEVRARLGYVD